MYELFFKLYLMLHICVQKFDVTSNFEIFLELNMALFSIQFLPEEQEPRAAARQSPRVRSIAIHLLSLS